ncbi:hypothetical protein Efla_000295 [Eimeria flavescens]
MQQQATSSSNNSSSTAAVAAAAGKQHEAATDSWEVTAVHVCGGPPEDEGHPRSPCEGGPRPKGPPQASCSPGPLRGCDLAFKRVACSVKTKRAGKHKEQLTILHPISGVIPAGSVVALMGPSGSGKTTLLDCLSGRKQQHEGEVFLNGQPRTERRLKQVSIYVPQEPYYSGHEIVREVLDFSAALKTKHSAAERRALVDGTLEFLGLTKVADKVKSVCRLLAHADVYFGVQVELLPFRFSSSSSSSSSSFILLLLELFRDYLLARKLPVHRSTEPQLPLLSQVAKQTANAEVHTYPPDPKALERPDCQRQQQQQQHQQHQHQQEREPRATLPEPFSHALKCHPLQMYENPAECYLELVTPGCPHYCLDALAEAYERLQGPEDELRVERHLLGFKQQEKVSLCLSLSSVRMRCGSVTRMRLAFAFHTVVRLYLECMGTSCSCMLECTGSSPHVEQTGVAAAAEAEGGEADGEKETSGHREREAETTGLSDLSTLLDDTGARGTVASWLTQYSVLQRRAFRRTLRDKRALALSVVAIYCFAVLTGFLFFKVYPRKPVFYQLSAPALLTSTLSVIPFVNTIGYLERKLQFMHETADGYYFPGPHLLAETVTSCTMTALMVLPSLLLVFLFCGFPLSRLPMAFLLFFCFEAVCRPAAAAVAAAASAHAAAAAADGVDAAASAVLLMVLLLLPMVLLLLACGCKQQVCGFTLLVCMRLFALAVSMPAGLRFLSFMSPYFYLFDGFAISLYEGNSEIFDDPSCVKTFGYSSAAEVFSAFGLAGSLSNTTLSPSQWLWAVDVSVLLVSTLGAHLLYLFVWQRKKLSK